MISLSSVKKGQTFKVTSIPGSEVRAQAIRFGIAEGSTLECEEKVPAGPIIVRKNNQEIAIGRTLAKSIQVVVL